MTTPEKLIIALFFLLNFFSTQLSASLLLDKKSPVCIEEFYIKGAKLYYKKSSNGNWYSTTENYVTSKNLLSGFTYDANDNKCLPEPYLILGMDAKDWHFLNALIGTLVGYAILIFSIYFFITVGKGRL